MNDDLKLKMLQKAITPSVEHYHFIFNKFYQKWLNYLKLKWHLKYKILMMN